MEKKKDGGGEGERRERRRKAEIEVDKQMESMHIHPSMKIQDSPLLIWFLKNESTGKIQLPAAF